jgi:hypothetical protein
MGNPTCPKCGLLMQQKEKLTGATIYTDVLGIELKRWGMAKFWVCQNKSPLHGTIKYRVGAQVIPRI